MMHFPMAEIGLTVSKTTIWIVLRVLKHQYGNRYSVTFVSPGDILLWKRKFRIYNPTKNNIKCDW
jgi:hypothetical protein